MTLFHHEAKRNPPLLTCKSPNLYHAGQIRNQEIGLLKHQALVCQQNEKMLVNKMKMLFLMWICEVHQFTLRIHRVWCDRKNRDGHQMI